VSVDDDDEDQPNTPNSSVSTLTANTPYLARNRSLSYASSYNASVSSSFTALTTNEVHREVLQQSVTNPSALVGWKIFVEPYGTGLIMAVERMKFHTTRFVVGFPNDKILSLPLKRNAKKGSVAFHLVEKSI